MTDPLFTPLKSHPSTWEAEVEALRRRLKELEAEVEVLRKIAEKVKQHEL
jgi:hypothetical protein